jgi:hypothetical protein
MWKNQSSMANLGIKEGNLNLDEQLKVNIALRMMRKAHTKTARSEAERYVVLNN